MFEHGVIEEVRATGAIGGDRFTDDRFARDSRTARWKDIALAMYRGDPASHSPLRQKTVDLVSAAN